MSTPTTRKTLTFRIALLTPEQGDNPATWAIHQQVGETWRRIVTTPSFDTALIALFDAVPWDEETTFSHIDLAPDLFEFTFSVNASSQDETQP
jgi:hypothetical protein